MGGGGNIWARTYEAVPCPSYQKKTGSLCVLLMGHIGYTFYKTKNMLSFFWGGGQKVETKVQKKVVFFKS